MNTLRKAVVGTDVGLVRVLLDAAENRTMAIDEANSSGKSLLHLAAWRGSLDIISLLLERKASINLYSTGPSAPLSVPTPPPLLPRRVDQSTLQRYP